MIFKSKPGRLVMGEAVPYGQRWTYSSTDPMSEMTKTEYYSNVMHSFRSGDSLRVLALDGEEVSEVAEFLITAKTPSGFTMFEMLKPTKVAAAGRSSRQKPKVRNLKVQEGKGCTYLVDDDGRICGEFANAAEARKHKPELERAA